MSASKTLVAKTSKVTRAPPVHIPRSITLQPSLQVGAVNDPAEREAEAMASRVVASSAPAMLVPPDPKPGQNPSLRRSVEDQPNLDDLATPSVPAEQADVTVASPEDVETTDLKTEDTDELDQGTPQDTSGEAPAEDAPPIPDAPFPIMEMRRAETGAVVGRSGGAAPNDVASIVAAPGPGRPLPRAVRNRIEPHFGTSFADVRLHDSPADRRAAARIGARAFTHKNRIWLGDGESETNTRLMAHELTHVVQQTKGSETLPLAREPAVIRRGYFADKAESVARHLPGYTLLTVLVGRKFISGARVAMTAENLLAGFLGLIFGGALIFDRLKEAGVIEEAFDFVKGKLSELNLTWDRIKGDISEALDTLDPFKAARNIKNMIIGFVRDITRFVTAIAKKFLEFIVRGALKLAGSMGDQVWAILQKAGDTLNLILEDPLGFAKNLISSIVGGFQQFGTNILEHLKKGLLGWLFGSLTSAGIKLPEKLDFKGLISLVLQIIGVTYENFRKRLVKNLGPKGEKMVTMMEKSVEVVKILLKEGFAGIWQKLLGMIDSFKETMLGGLTTMVRDTLVKAGIGWLASLSNPVGAIVKIVLSIYNLIVTFIERFQQIKDVAEGIFSSIGSIAKGQIAKARDFIEETIGRTVPVVISFVAALIPISGITAKIQNVIKKLKQPVDKAMDKMITFVKNKAKKLFSKLIAKVNGKRKYPSVNFKIGAKQHRIFAKQNKSGKIEVQMASTTPEVIDEKEKGQAEELAKIAKADGPAAPEAAKIGKAIQKQTSDADNETAAEAKKIKGKSKKENQLDKIKQLEDELNEAAKELTTAAVLIDTNPHISSQSKDLLFRAAEPRIAAIEGQQDTHAALLKRSKTEFNTHIPDEVSSFYEMDHTIEKRFAKAILENLHLLDPDEVENRADEKAGLSADQRADRAAAYNANLDAKKAAGEKGLGHKAGKKTALPGEDAPPLGKIGTGEFAKIPETAPLFPAVAMYRHNHITNKGLSSTGPMIEDARKTKDPHGSVKKTIAAQLKLETEAMSAAIGADPNATPQLIKNVQDGIEKASAATTDIFGLENVEAREVKKEEVDPAASGDSTTTLSFTGGNGAPDFVALEGVGGEFSALESSKHLERDHIIDKAYPNAAKGLGLLSETEKTDLELKVQEKLKAPTRRNMTKARKARLAELTVADLFAPGSAMKKFTDNNGYAIPIYTPLANRVTRQTGVAEKAAAMMGSMGSANIDGLADYVIEGTGSALADVRRAKQSDIKPMFTTRSLEHSLNVANEYKAETVKTGSTQVSEDAAAAAKASMAKIKSQVAGSLQTARSKTDALFS